MRPYMEDCSECGGKGYQVRSESPNSPGIIFRCPKCGGRGELDWVEQVVGRRPEVRVPNTDQLIEKYKKDREYDLEDKRTV